MKTANEYLSKKALISRLEACQQELTEAYPPPMRLSHEKAKDSETIRDLRKQLAASIELCNIREEQIGELLKESEASQAEVKRLQAILDGHGSFCKAYIGDFVIKEYDPR